MNFEENKENLKEKIKLVEDKQHKIEKEMKAINQEIKRLKLERPSQLQNNRFVNYIRRLRTNLGAMFIGLIFLCIAILVDIYAIVIQDSNLGVLILSLGFISFSITIVIKDKKYTPVVTAIIIALILVVLSVYLSEDEATKWNYTTFGIAIIAIGLAIQSLYSGIYVEKKLDDIDKNIQAMANNTEPPKKREANKKKTLT